MLITEFVAIGAAVVSLFGTMGAIKYGNIVSSIKDADLAAYKVSAGVQIAKAQKDAADADKAAGDANKSAADATLKNTQLQIQLVKHEGAERETQNKLAAQNKQLAQFTQGLAQQQQGMAQQMQTTPSLNDAQVAIIANQLRMFSGQNIAVHVVSDARSQRLGNRFGEAFQKAGIKTEGSGTFMGPDYHGVMVVVHNPSPQPHPPLADALLTAISGAGITPHPAADVNGPKVDEVWLCIGPE